MGWRRGGARGADAPTTADLLLIAARGAISSPSPRRTKEPMAEDPWRPRTCRGGRGLGGRRRLRADIKATKKPTSAPTLAASLATNPDHLELIGAA